MEFGVVGPKLLAEAGDFLFTLDVADEDRGPGQQFFDLRATDSFCTT